MKKEIMSTDKWYDLLCALYMITCADKNKSILTINKLLSNSYYPEEIKEALEVLKKGFEEK